MSSPSYRRGQGLSPRQRRLLQASVRARGARPQSTPDYVDSRQQRTDEDDSLPQQPAAADGTATPAGLRVPLSPIKHDGDADGTASVGPRPRRFGGGPATSPLHSNPGGRTNISHRLEPDVAFSGPSASAPPNSAPPAGSRRRRLEKFLSDEVLESKAARHYRIVYRGSVTLLPSLACIAGDDVGGEAAWRDDETDDGAAVSRGEEVCVGHGEIVSTSSPERTVPVATDERGEREFVRVVRVDSVVTSAHHWRDGVAPVGGGPGCLGYLPLSVEGRAVAELVRPDEGGRLEDSVQRGPFRCEFRTVSG